MSDRPAEPLPPSFWSAFESIPAGSALPTIWKRHLGPDFETFAKLFLKPRPGEPAQFVPCPWNCGCSHKVVPRDNGTLAGLCQCSTPHCGEYTVLPDERITWELDWPKLTRSLCQAFDLQHKIVKLGLYNTLQIGLFTGSAGIPAGQAGDEIPAILTLASNQVEFLNIVAVLVARFACPFILFAPTAKHLGPAATELLANTGSALFPLDSHLVSSSPAAPKHPSEGGSSLAGSSSQVQSSMFDVQGSMFQLLSVTAPSVLFADLAPLLPDPSDEDLARRTFILLQQPDESTRRQPPDLYTVFHLYCLKELTIPQIARKCRCSIGTVANRLKLLEAKTGVPPEQLRRIAPQFAKFEQDYSQAERNSRRPRRY